MASKLKVDTIESTSTNGNITLDPNGTGLFLPNRTPCFFAELSADQTGVSDATETVVQFDNEDFDIGGIWNNSTYRLVVDADTVGYYFVSSYLFTQTTNTSEDQYIRLRKNGTVYVENYAKAAMVSGASDTSASLSFNTVIPLLTSGDYADVTIFSDVASGGTTNINQISATRTRTYISGFRMGGA